MKLPIKFEERMKKMLNIEYDAFLDAFENSPIYAGIRINTSKLGARNAVLSAFGDLEPVAWCADGFYADKSLISGNHPYHLAGLFYFQEPSAMSAVSGLPIEKGDYVLDLCAAPGGKSTQAGAILNGSGLLVSNEIVKKRADILSENIERMGLTTTVVTNETPQKLSEKYIEFFDKIIVDAPCSGEGMFRKEPQAIEEWSVEHTISCGTRQKHILDCAVKMLKCGGYLIYSTCTFAPEENEQVAAYLLENYDMELCDTGLDMLDCGRTEWSNSDFDMSKTRRIFPQNQKGEGHFIALFKKNGEAKEFAIKEKKSKKIDTLLKEAVSLYKKFEKSTLNISLDGDFVLFGDNLYLKPSGIDIDKIKVVRCGLHLGVCKKNRFEPSHALALALKKDDFKASISLDYSSSQLKNYLMGDIIPCDENGWTAVLVNDFPIGWGKSSSGMLKNHFPKFLRLKR
jgi:NOL1/NOP2/sun family putative RNA methylase